MTTERRTDARGKSSARVTFTDATSDKPSEGELHDIGRGGMFVTTKTPLPVGKRIDVEVHAEGSSPITGMARVVWVRDAAQGELPAGMGIKFIDVDNDALGAIDKIVGLKKNVRERTMLGIPAPKVEAPKAEVPKPEATLKVEVAVPPEAKAPHVEAPKPIKSRERTVLGIAPPAPREKELSWPDDPPDAPPEPPKPEPAPVKKEASAPALEIGEASLSEPINFSEPGLTLPAEESKKEPEPEAVKEPEPAKAVEPALPKEPAPTPVATPQVAEASMPEPRELPKREGGGGGKWIAVLLLLGVAGGAAYYFRDMIFPPPPAAPTPSATVSASASAAPSTTASAAPSATVETIDAAAEAAEDASVLTTTTIDAGVKDAGHEHDGGHHHDGGVHTHPPHPKPSATATGNDNPY
jgi:uncharacterized protein (TIGR02266 family)